MSTKDPDACLRATLTLIRLLATVITISCHRYSGIVSLLVSERSERAQSCSSSIEISDTYVYICISYRPVSRSIVYIQNQGPRAIARGTRFYVSTIDSRDRSITYM